MCTFLSCRGNTLQSSIISLLLTFLPFQHFFLHYFLSLLGNTIQQFPCINCLKGLLVLMTIWLVQWWLWTFCKFIWWQNSLRMDIKLVELYGPLYSVPFCPAWLMGIKIAKGADDLSVNLYSNTITLSFPFYSLSSVNPFPHFFLIRYPS